MLALALVLFALAAAATGVLAFLAWHHKTQARLSEKRSAAADSLRKARTSLILTGVGGGCTAALAVALVVAAVRHKQSRESDDPARANDTTDAAPRDTGPAGDNRPVRPVPVYDADGLPVGNDLDSVLTRLNHWSQRGEFFRYQIDTENLRFLKRSPGFARAGDVFRAVRGHAGTPAVQPRIDTIPFVAWQQTMQFATKDQIPELCEMLRAERVEHRQMDLFAKLAEFKDPRCAETVAPFLASPARRAGAEQILKELDSAAEKFVLPYLSATHDKDTRVAALQVVAQVGTAASAKLVEVMTRDPDLYVKHHSTIVFEKLSKKFGTQLDLIAAVAALKDGIAAMNGPAIQDSADQLDKAYRPDHPQRAEIFKRLIECCKVPDPKGFGKRASYLGALKWSAANDVGVLCELLAFSGGESVVFLKLKEYKDPRCAVAVAAFLADPLKSGEAADVLKAVGAPAARAVVPYALKTYPNNTEVPFATRLTAIDLLGDIATQEYVPLLRQLATELNVQAACNKALAKVVNRPAPE